MTLERPRRIRVGAPGTTAGIAVLAGLVAAALVAAVIDPFGPSLHDPDAAASVLYFDRIVSGQRLEAFVPTTPKPLLTALYGASWALTGEWRTLGLWTLVAFAVAVAASTALLLRIGGRPAAAFAVVALVASPTIAVEIAGANSLIWGLAGWAVAGLAIAGGPRRAWIAGLALAAAATFRTETLVVVALATAGLALLALRPGLAGGGGGDDAPGFAAPGAVPARRWSGLLLGWLALPIAALHDLLLTGDPLSWLRVPAGYTAITTPDLRPTPPLDFAADVVARYAGEPLLVALAVVGIAWLLIRRQLALATGLVGLTAGIAALIGFVAWRGVFVTARYFEQVDLGLIGAAAIGVGAIASTLAQRAGGRGGGTGDGAPAEALGVAAAVALAVVLTAPTAFFDGGRLTTRLATVRSASDHVADVLPTLRAALAADDSPIPAAATGPAGLAVVDPARATILVPRALWTRLARRAPRAAHPARGQLARVPRRRPAGGGPAGPDDLPRPLRGRPAGAVRAARTRRRLVVGSIRPRPGADRRRGRHLDPRRRGRPLTVVRRQRRAAGRTGRSPRPSSSSRAS